MQKLREMSDARHFCLRVTQPKMLALLKKTCIEPFEAGGVALIHRILSMEDGFEYMFKNRYVLEWAFRGLNRIYKLCNGFLFSPTYQIDLGFMSVTELAEVRLPCMHLLVM